MTGYVESTCAVAGKFDISEFQYLLDKIQGAEFYQSPFKHIVINDFLSAEHLKIIQDSPQIRIPPSPSTEGLIKNILARGYKVHPFPGCTSSIAEYLACFNSNSWPKDQRVEGFGLTFRMSSTHNNFITRLVSFMNSSLYQKKLCEKFAIIRPNRIDTSIQKYLSGYEISPHPDIRSKCLTYLLNINTTDTFERMDVHTHLLTFKPHMSFIKTFWEHNPSVDRCWVPWNWCTTEKTTYNNNSIVIFAPSCETLHAVKLQYNHLDHQRTQIYGNLWYTDVEFMLPVIEHDAFDFQVETVTK